MNITRISSVEYLQNTVAVGDAAMGTAITGKGMTAYYTQAGNTPGRWIGAGTAALNVQTGGDITSTEAVSVWQKFRNPVTGERLGAAPQHERKTAGGANDNQLAKSTAQTSRAVSGFDLTFTIPKDASILWALGDPALQQRIAQCHERALQTTLEHLEREIIQTRAGHGGVATVGVRGLIAGQWDHWDTRDGEPHLHSHVVVSNRVQRESDGKWVTLDSRGLYKHAVMLSETHQNLFLDEMHRELGIEWELREGVTSRAIVPDIQGMPAGVREAFSSRAAAIDRDLAGRVAAYTERTGHAPSHQVMLELKQDAWRATRKPKDKDVAPLSDKCEQWRERTEETGVQVRDLVAACVGRDDSADLTAGTASSVHDVLAILTAQSLADRQPEAPTGPSAGLEEDEALEDVATGVVATLERTRASWSLANVRTEAERITRLVRAATPEVRAEAIDAITAGVLEHCTQLTPTRYQVDTEDPRIALRGRAVFDDAAAVRWSSPRTLSREADLLSALTTAGVIAAPEASDVGQLVDAYNNRTRQERGFALAPDQDQAVRELVGADTRLSVLIGPAGTGKTTTMAAVRDVWESLHGPGSVQGMATSAQAAQVLTTEISTPATTIAKWLWESTQGQAQRAERIAGLEAQIARHPGHAGALRARLAKEVTARDRWQLRPGQLLIIDEASMTATHDLHALVRQADAAGARALLVGDDRQLDAVEAGGALGLLAPTGPVTTLTSVWRFQEGWEADASLRLRTVEDEDTALELVDLYDDQGRVSHGEDEDMREAAYTAARDAITAGRSAVLIAATNDVAHDLNEQAMHERRTRGAVDARRTIPLADGAGAGIGERIIARHNDRHLTDEAGDFIRNGTTMTVTGIHGGRLTALRDDNGAHITLPEHYTSQHAQLGYALTAHRAQGVTVDEAHLLLPSDASIPSELLYVGMTRGRASNQVYLGEPPEPEGADAAAEGHLVAAPEGPGAWRERLAQIMRLRGAEPAATTVRADAREDGNRFGRLVAEYEYLAALEPPGEVLEMIERAHGIDRAVIEESPIGPSLLAAWRAASATAPGPAEIALTRPISGLEPHEENDPEVRLRILTGRLRAQAPALPTPSRARIYGLTPRVHAVDAPIADLAGQVEDRIGARIQEITRRADDAPWAQGVPAELRGPVAIYRDLYDVRDPERPLGAPPAAEDTRRTAHHDALRDAMPRTRPTAPPAPIQPPRPDPRPRPGL